MSGILDGDDMLTAWARDMTMMLLEVVEESFETMPIADEGGGLEGEGDERLLSR